MKIAICDDEIEFAEEIAEYLRQYDSTEIFIFTTVEDIIRDNTMYDIAFLDIQIGEESGFNLATHLYHNNRECIISFFTSHSEYAVKGYSYNIFRYILKAEPDVIKKRLIGDVMREYWRRNKKLKIQYKNNTIYIPLRDIIYIESFKSIILVHTIERDIKWNKPINEAEKELLNFGFLRCHKSYIINFQYIQSISDNRFLKLKEDIQIPIGRKYHSSIKWALATNGR